MTPNANRKESQQRQNDDIELADRSFDEKLAPVSPAEQLEANLQPLSVRSFQSTRTSPQNYLLQLIEKSTLSKRYNCDRAVVLGQGGQGVSFLMEALESRELHVIKCMQIPPGTDPSDEVWDKETLLLRQLKSKYLCRFVRSERLGDSSWKASVRHFAEGATLRDQIQKKGRLTPEEALFVLREVLKGLSYMHNHTLRDNSPSCIIHRDIKPENIIVSEFANTSDETSSVKIIDLGIAVALEDSSSVHMTTSVKGTEAYMPIEQMYLDMPTVRSDIYSLGITIIESLLGKIPKRLTESILEGRSYTFLGNEGVPEELARILEGMVEYRESKRFQSADAVLAVLPASSEHFSPPIPGRGTTAELPEECPFSLAELEYIVERIPLPLKSALRKKSVVFDDRLSLRLLGTMIVLCSESAGRPMARDDRGNLMSQLISYPRFFRSVYNSAPDDFKILRSKLRSFVSPHIDGDLFSAMLSSLEDHNIIARTDAFQTAYQRIGITEIGKQSLALYYHERFTRNSSDEKIIENA